MGPVVAEVAAAIVAAPSAHIDERSLSEANEKAWLWVGQMLEGEEHLWTFLRVRGIEPTNNVAERALRHAIL